MLSSTLLQPERLGAASGSGGDISAVAVGRAPPVNHHTAILVDGLAILVLVQFLMGKERTNRPPLVISHGNVLLLETSSTDTAFRIAPGLHRITESLEPS
jgi:hypothetical protein